MGSLHNGSRHIARIAAFCALAAACATEAAPPAISAGHNHGLAVGTDGRVRSWGSDCCGELGTGRALSQGNPAAVAGLPAVQAVAVGYEHALALSNGVVWSWGANDFGQLGDGSTIDRSVPQPIAGLSNIVAVSAGSEHSLALDSSGRVWGMGADTQILGYGGEPVSTPTVIPGLSDIVAISAGFEHSLALRRDGTVMAWGGVPVSHGLQVSIQPEAVPGLSDVVSIFAGHGSSFAIKRDDTLWAWGNNRYGSLGDGTTAFRATPAQVPGISSVRAVAPGFANVIALRTDGTVWTWGPPHENFLAPPTLTPTPVRGLTGITQIAGQGYHALALGPSGLWTWGRNVENQLGVSGIFGRTEPARVSLSSSITSIAANGFFSLVTASNGTTIAWGSDNRGQLGRGASVNRTTPGLVGILNGITAIEASYDYSLAVTSGGAVWGWGKVPYYRNSTTPVQVAGLRNIVAVSGGFFNATALDRDGTVFAWGSNERGELGSGTVGGVRDTPAPVVGLSGVTAISTGSTHTLALKGDGSVWAWGHNRGGQLGDGTTTDRGTPIQVRGLPSIVAISAATSSLAVGSDGSVWEWGNAISPNQTMRVEGLANIVAVAAGWSFALALDRDGHVWGWGLNDYGQLGRPDRGPSVFSWFPPARIAGISDVVAISAGYQHALAMRRDGSVWSWGRASAGQLGDGTYVDKPRPVVLLREGATGSIEGNDWYLDLQPAVASSIPAESVPAFLVSTSGDLARLDAQIRFRAADIGTVGSIYVFALAPASMVRNAQLGKLAPLSRDGKADATECVLAQLTPSGQLIGVSAANLQASTTGVLSAQGAAVGVLNAVPVTSVGGSTVFVGYGTSGDAMVNSGNNRGVVTIPGATECRAQSPQTGWWWNPQEDGRGFSIERRGKNLFFAAFLYDVSGRSTWHVSSGPVSLEGAFYTADLLSAGGGQTLGGAYPGFPSLRTEGTISLAFDSASAGRMAWPGGTVPIQRFNIVPNGLTLPAVAGQPESGWWWNEQESGRGFFMEFQNGWLDIAGYMYDDAGNPVWYLTVGEIGGSASARTFSGNWWSYGGGQTLTGPWRPNARTNDNVAPLTIQFSGPETALMTLPNGRTTALTRHRF